MKKMEVSVRIDTIEKNNQPKIIDDGKGVTIVPSLLLEHRKEKFAHIRVEKRDYGNIEKLTLFIDKFVFKEWIINKETRKITKTLDHFS